MPPSFFICCNCWARSFMSNSPFFIFLASRSPSSWSKVSAAFSTRLTTSPMSRMRFATRSGWKASSASSFSPTPRNLIGAPVTARMESAAPPRASPSARVSTMPESATRSLKLLAMLTASWPVRLSATSSVSCGLTWSRTLADFRHQLFVDVLAAGGVEDEDVIAADLGGAPSRAWRCRAGPGLPRSEAWRRRPARPGP